MTKIELSSGDAGNLENWLHFLGLVIPAATWPLAVVIVILVFRKPLAELIAKLKSVDVAGATAFFEHQLAKAEAQQATEPLSDMTAPADADVEVPVAEGDREVKAHIEVHLDQAWLAPVGTPARFQDFMVRQSPKMAVLLIWDGVVRRLRELGQAVPGAASMSVETLLAHLLKADAIDFPSQTAGTQLAALASVVTAPGAEITVESAVRFKLLADHLLTRIDLFQTTKARA